MPTSSNFRPPGPDSPASTPISKKTNSRGAPKRSASTLDRMPASTSRLPSKVAMLTVSSAPIRKNPQCNRAATRRESQRKIAIESEISAALGGRRLRFGAGDKAEHRLGDFMLAHHD